MIRPMPLPNQTSRPGSLGGGGGGGVRRVVRLLRPRVGGSNSADFDRRLRVDVDVRVAMIRRLPVHHTRIVRHTPTPFASIMQLLGDTPLEVPSCG
jgi:hypothetical protein